MSKKKYIPAYPTHPGDFIKNQMELLDLDLNQLSKQTEISKETLKLILARKKDVDLKLALKLEKIFGLPADGWIKMQEKYYIDLHNIELKKQLEKSKLSKARKRKILSSVLNLFGLA